MNDDDGISTVVYKLRYCAIKVTEPHHGPSPNPYLNGLHQGASVMSTSNESYEDSIQILKNVMDKNLINKVVAELSASSLPNSNNITTRYPWNAVCDELLKFYIANVHGYVGLHMRSNDCFINYIV